MSATELRDWAAERGAALRCDVDVVGLNGLDQWTVRPDGDELAHVSGGFFTAHGLDVRSGDRSWSQLIIRQDEIGLLGILVQRRHGRWWFLLQAKVEPGNINQVQLSPTVQATRSNFTRLHRGAPTRYLDLFTEAGRDRVLVDELQSEQGFCFHRKRNRNMVVLTTADVEPHEDFRWCSIDEVHAALQVDNLVNMDARSVLACLPLTDDDGIDRPRHPTQDLMSWLNDFRMTRDVRSRLVGLSSLPSWRPDPDELTDDRLRLVGVRVQAKGREVVGWDQPMLAPLRPHVIGFLSTYLHGEPHVLLRAEAEPGSLNVAELGPTVDQDPAAAGPLLSRVLDGELLFDTVLSEEGGRFLHAQNRYVVAHTDDAVDPGPQHRWVSLRQLQSLVGLGHHVNVQARTLLACARTCVAT